MALPQIETGYKPEFGLGALYQGFNAANADQSAQEEIIKQFLANQQSQQMNPLEIQAKQQDIASGAYKTSPEYQTGMKEHAQGLGALGLGQVDTQNLMTRFNKARVDAMNPNLSEEERNAAKQQAGVFGNFLASTDPKNIAALQLYGQKQQGSQASRLQNLAFKEIAEARQAGRAPADWAVEIQNNPQIGLPQQQQTPTSAAQPTATQGSKPFTLRLESLSPEDRKIVEDLTTTNPKDQGQADWISNQLSKIAEKYPQDATKPNVAGAGALKKGDVLTNFDKNKPIPSTDSADKFVGASGTEYTPKDEHERSFFASLASPYRLPGQLVAKANKATTTMANEVAVSMSNISALTDRGDKVPSGGAWSNLKNDTLFGAVASNALKPFTKPETLQMEALVKPIVRMQAVLEYGGAGGTQADRDRMEKAIIQEFGTGNRVVALQKMGELKQAVSAALESHAADQMMTKEQREMLLKSYRAVDKAFPFTATDVITWQKSGMKQPFRDYIDAKLGGGSTEKPAYKVGDTKTINGVTYTRNEQGWIPK